MFMKITYPFHQQSDAFNVVNHKIPEALFGNFLSLAIEPGYGGHSSVQTFGIVLGLESIDLVDIVNPLAAKSNFHCEALYLSMI
jgi:hypothetical protein